jgi:hypothetical protein
VWEVAERRIRQVALIVAGAVVLAVPLVAGPVSAGPGPMMTPAPPLPSPSPVLVPLSPPGQPVVTEIGPDSAMVNWAPSDGPVFRYNLQRLTSEGWQAWTAGPTNSHRMINLTPSTSYTIRVWAAAMPGSGRSISPPSAETTFTTLPPGAPPVTPTATAPPPAPFTCRAVISVWSGGFAMNVTLGNPTGTTAVAWALSFRLGATARITQAWSTNVTQSGNRVTARPAAWNGSIPPNSSQSFGMMGSFTGDFQPPDDFSPACEVVVLR